MGFEPTNNGFANRPPQQSNPLQNKDIAQNDNNVLASCLAFLSQKDPDLSRVVERWFDLPEHIKQTIKTLVDTANTGAKTTKER